MQKTTETFEIEERIKALNKKLKTMSEPVFRSDIGRKLWKERDILRYKLLKDVEIEENPERDEVIKDNIIDPYAVPF